MDKKEMLNDVKEVQSFGEFVEESIEDSEMDLNIEDDSDLDVFTSKEGKLRVDGTVFVGSIQRRGKTSKAKNKKPGEFTVKMSNVVNTIGYKITNLETNEWYFMEKMEAIDLVRQLGVVNASIRPRKNVTREDDGKVITTEIHLNLHPIKKERPFTDADRLYPVFKLNKNGKMVKPTELFIEEKNCTQVLWNLILEHYNKRKPRNSKGYRKISREEKLNRIEQAMKAANFVGAKNPFSK